MDKDKKKKEKKKERKLKEKSAEVEDLFSKNEFVKCLNYIKSIDRNALRDSKIYQTAIICNVMEKRYASALALIAEHNLHGHTDKSFTVLYNEAICNLHLKNFMEAYKIFKSLLYHEEIDDEYSELCHEAIESILESEPTIEESIKQNVDEPVHETEAHKPSSSSTSTVESSSVVTAVSLTEKTLESESKSESESVSLEGIEAHQPSSSLTSSTSKVDPLVVVVDPVSESTSFSTSSSSSSTSSTSKVDTLVVVVEPIAESTSSSTSSTSKVDTESTSSSTSKVDPLVEPVAESISVVSSSVTVASSPQKTPEPESESFEFSENVSFKMNGVDKQTYDCVMLIGRLGTFKKTLIIKNEMGGEATSEDAPFKMKGGSFLLRYEFIVYSSKLLRNLYVVEHVDPVPVFFKRKLTEFKGNKEEQWWEFISKDFHTIFRGILCGLFALHSANMTCVDLDSSMYVTNDVQGRIFYARCEHLIGSRAQKDLDSLLSTMEAVVTLINPRPYTTDRNAWRKELVDCYKLPLELYHFFESLRDKKVARNKIQTTWLIDHSFFWPLEHKLDFFRILNDVFREGLITEHVFKHHFQYFGDLVGWNSNVSKDKDRLLNAIYEFKGDDGYDNGSAEYIIQFILAVINHANDRENEYYRGPTKLTPADIAMRIKSVCPNIYTVLYDVMCFYANTIHASVSVEERKLLPLALERCCSL